MFKKIISLMLVLSLLVALVPSTVLASDTKEELTQGEYLEEKPSEPEDEYSTV